MRVAYLLWRVCQSLAQGGQQRFLVAREEAVCADGIGDVRPEEHALIQLQPFQESYLLLNVLPERALLKGTLVKQRLKGRAWVHVQGRDKDERGFGFVDEPGVCGGVVGDAALEALATETLEAQGVLLRGVMAVAPLDEAPARAFERLAAASTTLRTVVPDAEWISAGMTADFPEAISMGATHLRIGSAITGPRPTRG